jgi:hypothetical protein
MNFEYMDAAAQEHTSRNLKKKKNTRLEHTSDLNKNIRAKWEESD